MVWAIFVQGTSWYDIFVIGAFGMAYFVLTSEIYAPEQIPLGNFSSTNILCHTRQIVLFAFFCSTVNT